MIAVIDVTGNNLTSLGNALQRLGMAYELTHSPAKVARASHVILPGVGAAAPAMQALRDHNLIEVLQQLNQPLLGICLGMQLLYEHSAEGGVECLGLVPGNILPLSKKAGMPVPHMGWNQLQWIRDCPLQQGVSENAYVYFVHSYAALPSAHTQARCQYSDSFTAIVQKNNVYGMQFHPEKSAATGLQLLENFCTLAPEGIY